jgi:hypothetical protein
MPGSFKRFAVKGRAIQALEAVTLRAEAKTFKRLTASPAATLSSVEGFSSEKDTLFSSEEEQVT